MKESKHAAIKAEERRSRLASMLERDEVDDLTLDKKRHCSSSTQYAYDDSIGSLQTSVSSLTTVSKDLSSSSWESKACDRKEQVTRLLGGYRRCRDAGGGGLFKVGAETRSSQIANHYPIDHDHIPTAIESPYDSLLEIKAHLVCETTDNEESSVLQSSRAKIMEEAKAELISMAAVASAVSIAPPPKSFCMLRWGLVALVAFVATGALVGGLCRGDRIDCLWWELDPFVKRAIKLVEIVNEFTLRKGAPVVYPPPHKGSYIHPEEKALQFLIETDSLSLSANTNRVVQRYALAVLWFGTGSWATNNESQASWISSSHECEWYGITCEDGYVTELFLDERKMIGTVPGDVFLLRNLTALNLPNNDLFGELPSFLTLLQKLQDLDLSQNSLSGEIFPSFMSRLSPSLTSLSLEKNSFTGTIQSSIGEMTNLRTLQLIDTGIQGSIPNEIAHLTHLSHLRIGGPLIEGLVPPGLQQLTALESIELTLAEGSSDTLWILSEMGRLTHLSCVGVEPSGTTQKPIPETMGSWWPALESLELVHVPILNRIPPSMALWTNLHHFSVLYAQLTGTLPTQVVEAWAKLESFEVGWNQLSGTIPSDIASSWPHLVTFNIRENQFSGQLPSNIGLWKENLNQFVATSNRLNGTIPSAFGTFSNEISLSLNINRFTGTTPFCSEESVTSTARVDCDGVACYCCLFCL